MNMSIENVLHLLEDNQEFLLQEEAPKFQNELPDDIDMDGLDEEDIEEINRFVEFLKNKKNNGKK